MARTFTRTAVGVAIALATSAIVGVGARPAAAATSTVLVTPNHATPVTLTFGTTADVRRVKFQGMTGQVVDITTGGGTFADNCAVVLTLATPNGASLGGSDCVGIAGGRSGIVLPSNGVYQASFTGGSVAGSVGASVAAHGPGITITPQAPPITIAMPSSGTLDLRFNSAAGRAIAAGLRGLGACASTATILAPDGTVEWGPMCGGDVFASPPRVGQGTTTMSGLHTLRISAPAGASWFATIGLFAGTNPVTTTTIDAPAVNVTLLPGQEQFVQFAGVAGDSVGIRYATATYRCVDLLRPDGSLVHQDCSSVVTNHMNDTKLDVTGNWRVRLRTTSVDVKRDRVAIVRVADPTAVAVDGPPVPFVFSSPGETNHAEFVAQRGEPIAVIVAAGSILCPVGLFCGCTAALCPKTIEVRDPNGNVAPGGTAVIDVSLPLPMVYLRPTITTTGTWSVWISATSASGASVRVARAPDLTSSVTPGATVVVDTAVPAQRAVVSFPVVGGHRYGAIVVRPVTPTFAPVDLDLRAIASVGVSTTVDVGTSVFVGPMFAATDGFGSLTALAEFAEPMHISVRIVDLAPATTAVTLGTTSSVVTTVPHQLGRFTFAGTTGQKITVTALTNTHVGPVAVRFVRPDGTQLGTSRNLSAAATFLDPVRLDASGTWTVETIDTVLPGGTLAIRLGAVVDLTGTIVPDGAARSFVLTTPGQQARYTFTRLAGQPLRIRTALSTLGTMNLRVVGPLGTTVQTCAISGTTTVCPLVTAPTAGTYTLVVDPPGTALGSATLSVTSS